MHEVARVLVSLSLRPPTKPLTLPPKPINYSQLVAQAEAKQQFQQLQQQQKHLRDNNSSDAEWFVRFGEVISKNTL